MVTHRRQTDQRTQRLGVMHRRILSLFLAAETKNAPSPRRVPAWQAWLGAAWCIVVGVCYIASVLGRLP